MKWEKSEMREMTVLRWEGRQDLKSEGGNRLWRGTGREDSEIIPAEGGHSAEPEVWVPEWERECLDVKEMDNGRDRLEEMENLMADVEIQRGGLREMELLSGGG